MKSLLRSVINYLWSRVLSDAKNLMLREELSNRFFLNDLGNSEFLTLSTDGFHFVNFSSKTHLKPYSISNDKFSDFPRRQLFRVNDAIIYGNIGIASVEGRIIIEPSLNKPYYVSQTGDRKYFLFSNLIKGKRLKGQYIMLSASVSNNYFMWLMYFLPLLRSFSQVENKPFVLLREDPSGFQTESLQYLGFNKIYRLGNEKKKIKVEELLIPSFDYIDVLDEQIGHYNIINPQSITWINSLTNSLTPSKERIYLTRNKADQRRIINESELLHHLKPLGFKVIETDNLSFKSQIEIFGNAEIIIAPHGAALANIVFSKKALVIELYPDNRSLNNPKNFQICSALDHSYHLLILAGQNSSQDMIVNNDVIDYLINEIQNIG